MALPQWQIDAAKLTQVDQPANTTGLINTPTIAAPAGYTATTAITPDQAKVSSATATPINTSAWNVTAPQTVEGRVQNLMGANDSLQQQAQTMAKQEMAQRGLLSSSMAVGAARDAQNRAALPIASQDASTMARAGEFNAQAENTASLQGAQLGTNVSLANTGAENRAALESFGAKQQTSLTNAQAQNTAASQGAQQMQAANIFNAQQINERAKMDVLQQYDLTKMDVQVANTIKQMDAQQLNELDRMAKSQGYNLATMTAQQVNELSKLSTLQNYDLTKMDTQSKLALTQMSAQQLYDVDKMAKAQGYNLESMNVQQINEMAKQQAQIAAQAVAQQRDISAQAARQQADISFQNAMQIVKGDQAKVLADTEAKYRTAIQTSDSASRFYTAVLGAMTTNQTATGTTNAQKADAATYFNNSLRNGLAIISSAGGASSTDLSSLLKF